MATKVKVHEYVRTRELADQIRRYLNEHDTNNYELARRAGVSPRAITKVLNMERPYQTVRFADRIMLAMGQHISELETVFRRRKQNRSKSCQPKAAARQR